MQAAIVRGNALNKWEMQNFEPLIPQWNIVACGSQKGIYPTGDIHIPIRCFRPASATFDQWGYVARVVQRLHLARRPDDFLVGLEPYLADILIAHAAETHIAFSEQAVRAGQRYGTKVILTCWETIPFAYEEDALIRNRRAFVRANTDLFLATTTRAARALKLEGVEETRIRIVMPGVDVERFKPGPRSPILMQQYGLAQDDIVLLFVGRLIREKGVRELVLACRLLLRSLPEPTARKCRLLIAGNGPQRDFITALIQSLGLAEQAQIVGGVDYMQIHALHQVADIFVLPSIATPYWEEQYGMVLAEAMACGKPVVSTATGGIPEVVGEGGILVPPLEPEALAEALRGLIVDETMREELGRKARKYAVQRLNAEITAMQIGAAYAEMTNSSHARMPLPSEKAG